jgi:hypothetical protein
MISRAIYRCSKNTSWPKKFWLKFDKKIQIKKMLRSKSSFGLKRVNTILIIISSKFINKKVERKINKSLLLF